MKTKDFLNQFQGMKVLKTPIGAVIYPEDMEGQTAVSPYSEWVRDYGVEDQYPLKQGIPIENHTFSENDIVVVVGFNDGLAFLRSVFAYGDEVVLLDEYNPYYFAYFHFAEPLIPVNSAGRLIPMQVILDAGLTFPRGYGCGLSRGGCFVSFPHKTPVTNWVVDAIDFAVNDPNGMYTVYKTWLNAIPLEKLTK